MASTGAGGAPAVKGLRLITMSKGPDGYGFHMYTDKKLQVRFLLFYFFSCLAPVKKVAYSAPCKAAIA